MNIIVIVRNVAGRSLGIPRVSPLEFPLLSTRADISIPNGRSPELRMYAAAVSGMRKMSKMLLPKTPQASIPLQHVLIALQIRE